MSPLLPDTIARALAPFYDVGLLSDTERYTLGILAPLLGDQPDAVWVALAFAIRAPLHGHIGADLTVLPSIVAVETQEGSPGDLPWPDGSTWAALVARSSAVDADGQHPDRPFVLADGLLCTRRYAAWQERLARGLLAIARGEGAESRVTDASDVEAAVDRLFATAHPAQRSGALLALAQRLVIVSGGPGTGKTYTIKRTLALLHHVATRGGGRAPRVALAAPTGKASVRMAEAIREDLGPEFTADERAWLSAMQPTTLHRLLGVNPDRPDTPRYGRHRPLPFDLIVVDEASMVDLPMMGRLVEAIGPHTQLIALGDRHQLASVEAGSVLADLTAPAAGSTPIDPCVIHYAQAFRFDPRSGIGQCAQAISSATEPTLTNAAAWLTGEPGPEGSPFSDLHHLDDRGVALSDSTLQHLTALWRPIVEAASTLEAEEDPTEALRATASLRVLCAHREGSRGVRGLNQALAQALTRTLRLRTEGGHTIGLPILITENRPDLDLMNGDIGIVIRGLRGPIAAFLGSRGVRTLGVARLPSHQPVLAMTIHRSQGSQFHHAAMVLPAAPSPLMTRELIYTALTRAQRQVTVIGRRDVLLAGLHRPIARSSRLREVLARLA
jgi:exodeoxyribonuclease V alpha subunit